MITENKIFNYVSDCMVDTFDTLQSIKEEIKVHKRFNHERKLNKEKVKNYEFVEKE